MFLTFYVDIVKSVFCGVALNVSLRTMASLSTDLSKIKNMFNVINTPKRKLTAFILSLILFTKVGTINILYILQYADCIIRLILRRKRVKYAASTTIYQTRVHLYDIDIFITVFLVYSSFCLVVIG